MTENKNARLEPGAVFQNAPANYIKKFPAFGRQLDEIRKRKLIPNRRVIISFDWQIGKAFPRIVVTKECPPEQIEFKYLAGLHCQIAFFDHDAAYLPRLIDELMRIKPATIATFNMSAVERGESAFTMIHVEAGYEL